MNRIRSALTGSLPMLLLLSACADTYYRDQDHDYRPQPSYEASRSHLIGNCQEAVEYNIERRLGHRARVDFGSADLLRKSRHLVVVEGGASARHRKERHRLDYRCDMDRSDAEVRKVRLFWRDDPDFDSAEANRNAARACKKRIRHHAERNIRQDFRLEFKQHQVEKLSKHQRKVTGKAVLKGRHGKGRIAWECRVRVKPVEVQSAGYRWIENLPSRPAYGDVSQPGKKAKNLCQRALVNKLKLLGHEKIRVSSSSVEHLKENKWEMRFTVYSTLDGGAAERQHHCKVNIKREKILKLD